MAKMSIYLPDELKARMDSEDQNWSSVAQRAIELQINSTRKAGKDMQSIVERLRASKAKVEEVERPAWIEKGYVWAANSAEYDVLKRVGTAAVDRYFDENDPSGDQRRGLLAKAFFPEADELSDQQAFELNEALMGKDNFDLPSGRQVVWFIEGAQQVWEQVKEQI